MKSYRKFGRKPRKSRFSPTTPRKMLPIDEPLDKLSFDRPGLDRSYGLQLKDVYSMYREDRPRGFLSDSQEKKPIPSFSSIPTPNPMTRKTYDVSIKVPEGMFDENFAEIPYAADKLLISLTYFYLLNNQLRHKPKDIVIEEINERIKAISTSSGLDRILFVDDSSVKNLIADVLSFSEGEGITLYEPTYYEELLRNILTVGFFDLKLETSLEDFFKYFLQNLNPPGLLNISENKARVLTDNYLKDVKSLKKDVLKALIDSDFKRTDEQVYSLLEGRYNLNQTLLRTYVKTLLEQYRRAPSLKSFTQHLMKQ